MYNSIYIYKYHTTLNCSSYDVINILAIFTHGISLEKKRGDLNLRRYQCVARLLTDIDDAGSSPHVANEFFFKRYSMTKYC